MEFKTNYATLLNEWLPEMKATNIGFEEWLIREVSKARKKKEHDYFWRYALVYFLGMFTGISMTIIIILGVWNNW